MWRRAQARRADGHHPVLVVRPLVEPVVTRIMGILRRHGTTLSPAAQQFHQLLKERWGTVKPRGWIDLPLSGNCQLDAVSRGLGEVGCGPRG